MKILHSVLTGACLLAAGMLCAQKVAIDTDKPAGVYSTKTDKTVTFTVTRLDKTELKPGEKIVCTVWRDGREDPTSVSLSAELWNAGEKFQVSAPVLAAGWTRLLVRRVNEKGNARTIASQGILTDVETLTAATPDPADFDKFWADQIAGMPKDMKVELKKVDMKDGLVGYNFKLDCGGGNYAYGSVAWPADAKPKSLPAILQVFGASTFAVRGPSPYYAHYGIHAIMCPHSVEVGRDAKYNGEMRKSLLGYSRLNADDRDSYYMKGMILRVVRTLQYIESLPVWDGKTLITHGESQGGFQSIVGAALDPKVSFCLAMVPAMSEHLGYLKNRVNGWPHIIPDDAKERAAMDPAKLKKLEAALPYFDNVNFARRIHCPVWISTGLNDTTCPPSGVAAVFNALPKDNADKHFCIVPKAGHDAGCADVVSTLHSLIYPPEGPAK